MLIQIALHASKAGLNEATFDACNARWINRL
jgi:hypothetical protein